ncbi:uncharacterized protein RJT21DRAFT_119041 [Scheffersomyces amazonensis]|uniref:uncharacterized protein n=1 Tax=Scheffersomyces amazonensis TaxID=1078765 RepID=UPI00315DA2B8
MSGTFRPSRLGPPPKNPFSQHFSNESLNHIPIGEKSLEDNEDGADEDEDEYEYEDEELENEHVAAYLSNLKQKLRPTHSRSKIFPHRFKIVARLSILSIIILIVGYVLINRISAHVRTRQFDPYWVDDIDTHQYSYKDDIESINLQDSNEKLRISEKIISSRLDAPFQLGCSIPDTSQPRANAAFVVLARNSEVENVVKSMKSLERHFNQWYNYPWIFLNDEEFNDNFKQTVSKYTASKIEFGTIPADKWNFNPNINKEEFNEYINGQGDRGIMYGNLESYHKMCRFYSGFFYKHELVKKLDWYWRVEPDVEFYCDITYDPFIEMEKRGKVYGFTVMIHELYYTVPGLFRETKAFIKKSKLRVGTAWDLFIHNSKFTRGKNSKDYDNIRTKHEILKELEENINIEKFLKLNKKKDKHVKRFNPELIKKLSRNAYKKPNLYEDRIDREEYNLCHFWSNFEIARTSIFTSPEYENYFNYLERSGGFYKERWGDAPIHSLAVGMMLDLKDIHYFRDIGYRHSTLGHCPGNSKKNQLRYKSSDTYTGYQEDSYWLSPDKPTNNGVGCRCRCPSGFKDIEDSSSGCINLWREFTSDSFATFEPVNLDEWESKLNKEVSDYISRGGDYGYSNIIEKLHNANQL